MVVDVLLLVGVGARRRGLLVGLGMRCRTFAIAYPEPVSCWTRHATPPSRAAYVDHGLQVGNRPAKAKPEEEVEHEVRGGATIKINSQPREEHAQTEQTDGSHRMVFR